MDPWYDSRPNKYIADLRTLRNAPNFKNATPSQRAKLLEDNYDNLIRRRRVLKKKFKNKRLGGDRCKNNYECKSKRCIGKNWIGTRWGTCKNAEDEISAPPGAVELDDAPLAVPDFTTNEQPITLETTKLSLETGNLIK